MVVWGVLLLIFGIDYGVIGVVCVGGYGGFVDLVVVF